MYWATYISSSGLSPKSTPDINARSISTRELPAACIARLNASYIQGWGSVRCSAARDIAVTSVNFRHASNCRAVSRTGPRWHSG